MKPSSESPIARRQLLAAAGTTGALAAAATVLAPHTETPATEVTALKAELEQGGGYQVTAHVLRYYQTAKV
jgi:hypothetical protein